MKKFHEIEADGTDISDRLQIEDIENLENLISININSCELIEDKTKIHYKNFKKPKKVINQGAFVDGCKNFYEDCKKTVELDLFHSQYFRHKIIHGDFQIDIYQYK